MKGFRVSGSNSIREPRLVPASGKLPFKQRSLTEPIVFEWLALVGGFGFALWLLGVEGVWGLLLRSDPTGITFVILIVFTTSTLWSGRRAIELASQRERMVAADSTRPSTPLKFSTSSGWADEYFSSIRSGSDSSTRLDILLEQTHGPHGTAWWVNGLQLKLGLLGKVIGFSILALQIGQIQNFDPSQSQELLRSLTSGLGVALLTTMVGLVANILLGVQLTRLDRYADSLVTDIQRIGLVLESQRPT